MFKSFVSKGATKIPETAIEKVGKSHQNQFLGCRLLVIEWNEIRHYYYMKLL